MVFQTEKALKDVGDKLADNDKEKVEADLKALKDIIEKTNPESMTDEEVDEIKAGKEKLMESAQDLFSKLYESQAPNANTGTGAEQAGAAEYAADDVVDADFKEV